MCALCSRFPFKILTSIFERQGCKKNLAQFYKFQVRADFGQWSSSSCQNLSWAGPPQIQISQAHPKALGFTDLGLGSSLWTSRHRAFFFFLSSLHINREQGPTGKGQLRDGLLAAYSCWVSGPNPQAQAQPKYFGRDLAQAFLTPLTGGLHWNQIETQRSKLSNLKIYESK